MAGFAELPAFPDALPAVTSLFEAGVRIACLTNEEADLTAAFTERSGLAPMVERVISVSEYTGEAGHGGLHVRGGRPRRHA